MSVINNTKEKNINTNKNIKNLVYNLLADYLYASDLDRAKIHSYIIDEVFEWDIYFCQNTAPDIRGRNKNGDTIFEFIVNEYNTKYDLYEIDYHSKDDYIISRRWCSPKTRGEGEYSHVHRNYKDKTYTYVEGFISSLNGNEVITYSEKRDPNGVYKSTMKYDDNENFLSREKSYTDYKDNSGSDSSSKTPNKNEPDEPEI